MVPLLASSPLANPIPAESAHSRFSQFWVQSKNAVNPTELGALDGPTWLVERRFMSHVLKTQRNTMD